MLLNFITWDVDPIFFHLGPFSIGSYFILLFVILIYSLVLGYRYFFQRKKNVINSNDKKNKISLDKKDFKLIRNDDQFFAYAVVLFILLRVFRVLGEDLDVNLFIRWYGLSWALGIWATLMITQKIFKNENLPEEWVDKLFIYTVIGTIIGSRLGHCFFYEWDYYSANPLEILFVWKGGLASHGGAIGIAAAIFLYNKNVSKKGYIWVMDRLLVGVTLCAASIRFGNLMNSEIYGHATSVPWAFYFPRDGEWDGAAHHPTQIYEMLAYIAVFVLLWWLYWKKEAYKKPGLIFGVFLIGMFGARFTLEMIKLNQVDFESGMLLNMGQILSIPFIVWGIWLIIRSKR